MKFWLIRALYVVGALLFFYFLVLWRHYRHRRWYQPGTCVYCGAAADHAHHSACPVAGGKK